MYTYKILEEKKPLGFPHHCAKTLCTVTVKVSRRVKEHSQCLLPSCFLCCCVLAALPVSKSDDDDDVDGDDDQLHRSRKQALGFCPPIYLEEKV